MDNTLKSVVFHLKASLHNKRCKMQGSQGDFLIILCPPPHCICMSTNKRSFKLNVDIGLKKTMVNNCKAHEDIF